MQSRRILNIPNGCTIEVAGPRKGELLNEEEGYRLGLWEAPAEGSIFITKAPGFVITFIEEA